MLIRFGAWILEHGFYVLGTIVLFAYCLSGERSVK